MPQLGEGTTGTWWVETRDAAKHPTMHRTALQKNNLVPKLIVLRLRNPARDKSIFWFNLCNKARSTQFNCDENPFLENM